jgi:hypothetical protein
MIASPADVEAERRVVREAIYNWNATYAQERKLVLLPLAWESHASPKMGDRAQAIVNNQVLEHCDLLVAVFWTRLGSPTGEAPSGTVEEINRHLGSGKSAMLYFSDAPVRLDSVDEAQYQALQLFKKESKQRGLIETYSSQDEFREKFSRQLSQTVLREFESMAPHPQAVEVSTADRPTLSSEAQQLIVECSLAKEGLLICINTMDGMLLQTNRKQFVERRNPRSEAKWKAAVKELVDYSFLEAQGAKGEVYGMTDSGYQIADQLKLEMDT